MFGLAFQIVYQDRDFSTIPNKMLPVGAPTIQPILPEIDVSVFNSTRTFLAGRRGVRCVSLPSIIRVEVFPIPPETWAPTNLLVASNPPSCHKTVTG